PAPFGGGPPRARWGWAPPPAPYARGGVRAAGEAPRRDLRTASFVTQQVLTTAISASTRSSWPSRSSVSRIACASECETLQPRKRTENVATGGGCYSHLHTSAAHSSLARRSTCSDPRTLGPSGSWDPAVTSPRHRS